MSWQNGIRVFLVSSLLLLSFSYSSEGSAAGKRKRQQIAGGPWGGEHIRIDVGARSATIEYDCANGSIAGPLSLDSRGRFRWRGTHVMVRGGPVRSDETANKHAASYTGWIKGDTMTLTVKLTDTNQAIGTFELTRGNPGKLRKCL